MVRFIAILLFILVGFIKLHAQETIKIAEAEAKSASKKMAFKVNSNTSDYNITYHKLEFTVDPAIAFISGKVTTTFTALKNMSSVTFDLDDNLTVSEVTQNEQSLSFTQNSNDELVITLQSSLSIGNSASVTITYSGNPVSSGFGSFEVNTHNGTPVLWTLSEPYGALGWWPCKQDLNDKIDEIDVYISAPEQYTSVSNGLEKGATVSSGIKTTHFNHKYPIPAYLIAIAVTNYQTYSHNVPNNGNPFPIVNYVYPESLSNAQNSTGVTVDIMNVFIDLFGNYPFANEKYGHAQFGWGGGMEHTTVSFMGNFSRNLIAHELAHQWFGNKVTCGSWKDIWLNEGFATYLTGITVENLDGNTAFKNWRFSNISSITSLPSGAVYLSDADTTSVGRIFNSRLSYRKGAMVLHMLRRKLGDTSFFNGLKNYLSDSKLAYNYAKTTDLINHLEASSGKQLSEFFNDWVYNQGYPTYNVEWHQPASNTVNITLNQTQSNSSVSFFEANVPIRLKGSNGEILDLLLENSSNNQSFAETVSFPVASVEIDPDYHLISNNNSVTLNLDKHLTSNLISVFPNPVSSFITINKPKDVLITSLKVFNSLGQQIYSSTQSKIDFSKFASGTYFIKIVTNKNNLYKTIIKE